MSHYAMITGSNAFKYNVSSSCKCGDRIESYKSAKEKISAVAVGPNNYFAVVCDNGKSWYLGPDGFNKKMKDIQKSKIKHISFGTNNQWAITMQNGWVHCELASGGGLLLVYCFIYMSSCIERKFAF